MSPPVSTSAPPDYNPTLTLAQNARRSRGVFQIWDEFSFATNVHQFAPLTRVFSPPRRKERQAFSRFLCALGVFAVRFVPIRGIRGRFFQPFWTVCPKLKRTRCLRVRFSLEQVIPSPCSSSRRSSPPDLRPSKVDAVVRAGGAAQRRALEAGQNPPSPRKRRPLVFHRRKMPLADFLSSCAEPSRS